MRSPFKDAEDAAEVAEVDGRKLWRLRRIRSNNRRRRGN
jgi:hypothetical protein